MPIDKSENHKKIVAAAKREFLEFGYQDASMRRIASAAGMSASGLYKHFQSKEEMFASLVEPVIEDFWALYLQDEKEAYSSLNPKDVGITWENKRQTVRIMEFIYEHYDEFKLIVCKSQGTSYEDFLHDIAITEEESTLHYLEELKKIGIVISPFREKEFHLLVTTNINAVFQAVLHDLTAEEAMHYAATLDRFFLKGWRDLFGL